MTTHHFEPTRYYNTIGSHEPVLRIGDGDTVVTSTIDAWGGGPDGKPLAPHGNPQTGPFFVEGAEPGDVLAVTFERLVPNRDTGFTRTPVAENVVDPAFVRKLPGRAHVTWRLDCESWTATPLAGASAALVAGVSPAPAALAGLVLPLAPMVGCFGVAPEDGQAISTDTSGPYGGNMDYRGFGQGSTVYLPVAAPGALFFLGDGHAVQGDGEIVGTGIETSFAVQFTVRVLKGKTISWPRGENADYIFAVGNARPLDQALQHATTEMLRWLAEDYGLDTWAASTLLGQCVAYDLGNVYDPAYTMVCKVPKRVLAMLARAGG